MRNSALSRSSFAGKPLVLIAILLMSLNLRSAVASMSPIFAFIQQEMPLGVSSIAIIGMLPPVLFAACGVVTPALVRRTSLEFVTVLALSVQFVGLAVRTVAPSGEWLIVGSALAFGGIGMGNVLLPPLIKKNFPESIAIMTTAYTTLISVGTFVPALLSVPVASAAGWRFSAGIWAVLALLVVLPWAYVLRSSRNRATSVNESADTVAELDPGVLGKMRHSRVAWAVTLIFTISSMNAYTMFSWLPAMLSDTAGVSAATAGSLLALFAFMGLPAALLVPYIATRLGTVSPLIYFSIVCGVLGYAGLLFFPGSLLWLWVVFAGLGPTLFSVSLLLINRRTRSHHSSVALSGFVQSVGYTLGALGPLGVGLIHDATGGWTVPFSIMGMLYLAAIWAARVLRVPRPVEADWAARGRDLQEH